jgi:hypothetical protein
MNCQGKAASGCAILKKMGASGFGVDKNPQWRR